MASPLSKLPKDVARELRRHVSPRPLKASNAKQQQASTTSKSLSATLMGCVAFTAAAFSIPYLAHQWIGNLNAKETPLTSGQIRRGAFGNSGTKDIGRDPQWDFRKGLYKKDDNYWAIFDEDKKGGPVQQAFGSIVNTAGQPPQAESSSTTTSDATRQ